MPIFRSTAPSQGSGEISDVRIRDGDGTALADVSTDGTNNALWVQSANTQIKDAAGHALNVQATGEADVNLAMVNDVTVTANTGVVGAGTLRVTVATDDLLNTNLALVSTSTGVADSPMPVRRMAVAVRAETTFPAAVDADGDMVDLLADEYGRLWLKAYDSSTDSFAVTDTAPALMATEEVTFTTMTAPGVTTSVEVSNYHHFTFQITIAAINTTVTMRMEGSLDNAAFFNMDDNGVDYTVAANDTYSMRAEHRKVKYVRFRFVSETGGTAVTAAVKMIAGN